ncbi:MAG TPA: helix-turn-helix transcriptional regulator [Thermoanaerobaculia bacterium]|nr:helix-turn-helix transcriptional regulator [Thermoanaerobaculia bacterium]
MMNEAGNVGVTVSFLRKLRGWSQKELAEAAGLHQSLISLYERGVECPTRGTLERLALAVGLPFAVVEEHLALVRRARASLGKKLYANPDFVDVEAVVESVIQTLSEALAEVVRPAATELLASAREGRTGPD